MDKALLLSLLIGTMLVPIYLARDARPRRGLRRTTLVMTALTAFWVMACGFIYVRLL